MDGHRIQSGSETHGSYNRCQWYSWAVAHSPAIASFDLAAEVVVRSP
jgi:hypothetical protein